MESKCLNFQLIWLIQKESIYFSLLHDFNFLQLSKTLLFILKSPPLVGKIETLEINLINQPEEESGYSLLLSPQYQ